MGSGATRALAALPLALLITSTACSTTPVQAGSSPASGRSSSPPQTPTAPTAGPHDATCRSVLVAAGDIVNDTKIADETGRAAAAQRPDQVLVLGDNQYPSGSLDDYRNRYDHTSWGQLKSITRPVPGNHEYQTPGAGGYFAYFNPPGQYYAYDAGCGWRAYALNSEIEFGPQIAWLRSDLAAHPTAAVVAYWHQPRWSSGTEHGNNPSMQPLWTALAARAGVVLNGHEHSYERFAPIGRLRGFVIGTGGSSRYPFGTPVNGSQRRIAQTPGVLRLDLAPHGAYRWAFLNTAGTALDTGTGE